MQSVLKWIGNILQRMIDRGQVCRGTDAYDSTEEALNLAKSVTNERLVYSCRHRGDRRELESDELRVIVMC